MIAIIGASKKQCNFDHVREMKRLTCLCHVHELNGILLLVILGGR